MEYLKPETFICYAVMSHRNIHTNVSHHSSKILTIVCFFVFLIGQLKRYKTYAYLLRSRISQYPELEPSLVETCIGEVDESGTVTLMDVSAAAAAVVGGDGGGIVSPTVPDRRASPTTNRYSYRAAIYSGSVGGGVGMNRDNGGDIG